jgi:hypothetical protein
VWGQFDQARQEMKALRRLARTIPFPFVAAGALQVQAECALCTEHVQEAVKLFRRGTGIHGDRRCASDSTSPCRRRARGILQVIARLNLYKSRASSPHILARWYSYRIDAASPVRVLAV